MPYIAIPEELETEQSEQELMAQIAAWVSSGILITEETTIGEFVKLIAECRGYDMSNLNDLIGDRTPDQLPRGFLSRLINESKVPLTSFPKEIADARYTHLAIRLDVDVNIFRQLIAKIQIREKKIVEQNKRVAKTTASNLKGALRHTPPDTANEIKSRCFKIIKSLEDEIGRPVSPDARRILMDVIGAELLKRR